MASERPSARRRGGFGPVLREAREAARLSLRDLSAKLPYARSYFSKVETSAPGFAVTRTLVQRYDTALDMRGELLRVYAAYMLAMLPPAPDLIGREHEQQQVLEFFEQLHVEARTPRVLQIGGSRTIGSSGLAIWAAEQVSGHYPVLYVDLTEDDPTAEQDGAVMPRRPRDRSDVLGELLGALQQVDGATQQADGALEVVPPPPDWADRVALWRSETAGQQRRMLLVLDNACTAKQVMELLPPLKPGGQITVIITSHSMMSDLLVPRTRISLAPLTADDCAAVVARELTLAGHELARNEAVMRELGRLSGGSPLVAELLAHKLSTLHPTSDFAAVLTAVRGRDESSAIGVRPVRSRLSHVVAEASPDAQRLYCQLGAWPCDQAELSGDAIASLAGRAPNDTVPLIGELTEAYLLRETSAGGRYGMDPLVAGHAKELIAHDRAEQDAAARRVVNYYLASASRASAMFARWRPQVRATVPDGVFPTVPVSLPDARTWLQAERAALMIVSRVAYDRGYLAECWRLALGLRGWLDIEADLDLWRVTHDHGLHAATELRDRAAIATMRTLLADCHRRAGRQGGGNGAYEYRRAEDHAVIALEMWHQIADGLPDSLPMDVQRTYRDEAAMRAAVTRHTAWAMRVMAAIHRDQIFLKQALKLAESALAMLGPTDHEEIALTLGGKAETLRGIRDLESLITAEETLLDALEELKHLQAAERLVGWVHSVLAEVYLTRSRTHGEPGAREKAIASWNTSLDLVVECEDHQAAARVRAKLDQIGEKGHRATGKAHSDLVP